MFRECLSKLYYWACRRSLKLRLESRGKNGCGSIRVSCKFVVICETRVRAFRTVRIKFARINNVNKLKVVLFLCDVIKLNWLVSTVTAQKSFPPTVVRRKHKEENSREVTARIVWRYYVIMKNNSNSTIQTVFRRPDGCEIRRSRLLLEPLWTKDVSRTKCMSNYYFPNSRRMVKTFFSAFSANSSFSPFRRYDNLNSRSD